MSRDAHKWLGRLVAYGCLILLAAVAASTAGEKLGRNKPDHPPRTLAPEVIESVVEGCRDLRAADARDLVTMKKLALRLKEPNWPGRAEAKALNDKVNAAQEGGSSFPVSQHKALTQRACTEYANER